MQAGHGLGGRRHSKEAWIWRFWHRLPCPAGRLPRCCCEGSVPFCSPLAICTSVSTRWLTCICCLQVVSSEGFGPSQLASFENELRVLSSSRHPSGELALDTARSNLWAAVCHLRYCCSGAVPGRLYQRRHLLHGAGMLPPCPSWLQGPASCSPLLSGLPKQELMACDLWSALRSEHEPVTWSHRWGTSIV